MTNERKERPDRFTELEERFADYEVMDLNGDKIGKVDDLFINEHDEPEYVGVKMGLFGLSGSILIPWEICRVDEGTRRLKVSAEKERVKDGPSFTDDTEITPEYERQVREYYGLGALEGTAGAYGEYYSEGEEYEGERPGVAMGDAESGEFRGHATREEGLREGDLRDEDELRVQRTEEELRAGTREREAGRIRVGKRVYTERERLSVPKRREEVHVERVPAEGEAAETEIGDDEVRVPVTEEEVVVEKRPVKKEEIRVRKEPVEEEEVVEGEVRKEEVEVEDETGRRRRER